MGEETKNARRAVPQAMFWSIVTNGVLGLIMIVTYIVSASQDVTLWTGLIDHLLTCFPARW